MFLDDRDSSHNNSFLSIAYWLQDCHDQANEWFSYVYTELFINKIFWIKNPTYTWGNSDWRKSICKFLPFLKNIKCGSNGDQLEPALIFALISDKSWFIDHISRGIALKLGFIGETNHSFFRPRIWSIIFRSHDLKLFYWVLDLFENITPLERFPSTTRTIRDYIFLVACQITHTETIWSRLLKWRHRNTNWEKVFEHYFSQDNNKIIANIMPYDVLLNYEA